MKTITIPGYKNPFVVVINNTVYQYNGGETIEVPDDVAEAIEDAIELIPKPKRYLSKLAQLVEGSITELTINDFEGIEKVSSYAFYCCRSIEKVTIPNNIKGIESLAFYGCNKLKSVAIGNGVANIGDSAFEWCSALTSVYLPDTPPVIESTDVFINIKSGCVFYCKSQASLDAYKAATNWSTLTETYSFVVEE